MATNPDIAGLDRSKAEIPSVRMSTVGCARAAVAWIQAKMAMNETTPVTTENLSVTFQSKPGFPGSVGLKSARSTENPMTPKKTIVAIRAAFFALSIVDGSGIGSD